MKVILLAGGLGTRLSEETQIKPKPMVEIGGKPILWHIMKSYATHGFKEFCIALGYRGGDIKDYFLNYNLRSNSVTVDLVNGDVTVHDNDKHDEDWRVHLVNTGIDTQTGGRVKRFKEIIGNETFMLTYGDGVSDINIAKLLDFHRRQGKYATLTAVRPPARFGDLKFNGDLVEEFVEKPQIGEGWINGGFFILEPQVFDYIEGDSTIFEREPLEKLAFEGELAAYKHDGFWQCMDTLRDVRLLNQNWESGSAKWKTW